MAALNEPYAGLPITEVVPDAARVSGLTRASILQERRRVRVTPTGPSSVVLGGSAQQVTFNITDSMALMDPNSVTLSFDVAVTETNAAAATCTDDGAFSVWRRAALAINSVSVEDVDRCASAALIDIYGSCPQSWYDGPGSFLGLWKFATTAYQLGAAGGNTCAIAKNDVASKRVVQAARQEALTVSYSVPLAILLASFRGNQLWPLRSMGQVQLTLQTSTLEEALFSTGAGGTQGCTISNLSVEYDAIIPHSSYQALLEELTFSDAMEGLVMPVDSKVTTTVSAQAAAGATSDVSVQVTRASANLRSVHFVMQPPGAASVATCFQSQFSNEGLAQYQLRIGSYLAPTIPAQGPARQYNLLKGSFGGNPADDTASIVDARNFLVTTRADAGAVTGDFAHADCAVNGYCFDKHKSIGQALSVDGINTMSGSGSIIQADLRVTPPRNDNVNILFVTRATRYIRIKGGAVRIDG